MKGTAKMLAIWITAMMTLSCAMFFLINDVSDTEAANTPIEVSLNSPLEFDSTNGEASANTINTAAGSVVCSYANGSLVFSQSVVLKCMTNQTQNVSSNSRIPIPRAS